LDGIETAAKAQIEQQVWDFSESFQIQMPLQLPGIDTDTHFLRVGQKVAIQITD